MRKQCNKRSSRRGAITIYVAFSLSVIIAMSALAIDLSILYTAKAEMQRSADAAAMAATWELLDEQRLVSDAYNNYVEALARYQAVDFARRNPVLAREAIVDSEQDVLLSYWSQWADYVTSYNVANPPPSNAVTVAVQRDPAHEGSIALGFASALGLGPFNVGAQATAAYQDSIDGFRIDGGSDENAKLLPFALRTDSWAAVAGGAGADNYSYDASTGEVSAGSDGIPELNIYPGAGADQLPPGNFGTVDIGSSNNSSADIARQIVEGISAGDLSYFGGQLVFGEDGTLILNGDTGLSAGVKDELASIIGQPRAIPIFSTVTGPGNNANFTIIAFAGIRIMNVKLTGKMTAKELIIQPALVIDKTAVGGNAGNSYYVYTPVRLVQ